MQYMQPQMFLEDGAENLSLFIGKCAAVLHWMNDKPKTSVLLRSQLVIYWSL